MNWNMIRIIYIKKDSMLENCRTDTMRSIRMTLDGQINIIEHEDIRENQTKNNQEMGQTE